MIELLTTALFTVSACVAIAATIGLIRRGLRRHHPGLSGPFLSLSIVLLVLKISYVVFFVVLRPEQVLSTDGDRYLREIQQIAAAPWEWNPILGQGPDYRSTPKMGMSYLYGGLLFLHGAPGSLYNVLVINVVIAYVTCAVIFLLTLRLSAAATPALTAMFLTGIYPETLFWNARVVRENLTLLLVALLVYSGVHLFETRRPINVGYLLVPTGLLLITRAQLALLLPLIFIYYLLAVLTTAGRMRFLRSMPSVAVFAWVTFLGFELISRQIRAAAGSRLLHLPEQGLALWDAFTANIGSVLSLAAREEHGSLGIVLVPFTFMVFALFIATLLGFRRIFPGRHGPAGLLVFVVVSFTVALAVAHKPNIRFRSTVAPLVLSLVSVSGYYYWQKLGLPRIGLWPDRRHRDVPLVEGRGGNGSVYGPGARARACSRPPVQANIAREGGHSAIGEDLS